MASVSNGRIHLEIVRVDLADVQHLYAAAVVALCPYASIGSYKFFTHVLHPSSVGTAVVFGVPVIAPKLPSIVEMTLNHPHILYDPLEGPGEAFKTAERVFTQPTEVFLAEKWMPSNRVPYDDGERWRLILRTYEAVAFELLASGQRQKNADGGVNDTLD
jgi:beta-1,4-mannosyltransferase